MYAKTSDAIITRLDDGAQIPADPVNADYQAYLAWVDAGNTPQEPEPTEPPPVQSVTMRQAQRALYDVGLLQFVEDAIDAMPGRDGDLARIDWKKGATVERGSPLVVSMGALLAMDDQALDELFRQAAAL
jgi:hypothetical protein